MAAPSITIPQLQSVLGKPPPERREGTQETHKEFTSLLRALPGVMEAVILWDGGLQWEEVQRSPGVQFFPLVTAHADTGFAVMLAWPPLPRCSTGFDI